MCKLRSILCIVFSFVLVGSSATEGFVDEFLKTPEQLRAEMTASGLLVEAGRRLEQGDYFSATPYLTDYLERMKKVDNRRVKALMQDVRLKLGRIMVYQKDYQAAAKYFEQYMQNKPQYRRRQVLKYLAVSCFEIGEYENSIAAATNAFAPPPPLEEEPEEEVKVEELSEEELGGLTRRQLRRYQKQAQDLNDEVAIPMADEKPPEEPELSLTDKVLLNMTLAESHSALGEWEQSLEPYQFVIDHAERIERRGSAIMKMVASLSELGRFEETKSLIMELGKTELRYDIRVNTAMMNAATTLFNAGEYDGALAMYRMILPRQVLADYQLEKINEMRATAGLPFVEITVATNRAGRVESVLGYAYAERDSGIAHNGEGGAPVLPEMPEGLVELEESLGTLMSLPPYENDVIYRMGQLYLECGRAWEALGAFDLTVERAENDNLMKQAFCSALQVLVEPLEQYDRVEKRALPFLENHAKGVAPRQALYYLTMSYQRQDKYEEIKSLLPYLEGFVPAANPTTRQYDCELYYMQAIADLMLMNYKQAQNSFKSILMDYPDSHQEENLRYWYAMTCLLMQEYETAFSMFEEFRKKYPESDWMSSLWFQSGVCLFAMEKTSAAKKRFTYVIDTFPDSPVYSDACSMRGDITAAEEYLENLRDAQIDYREAIRTANKPNQAKYAVFQLAAVLELEAKEGYEDQIITLVKSYLDHYGEEADIATGIYWIGKINIAQGRIYEAVKAYMDAILAYGGDVEQEGVDLIIADLLKVKPRLTTEEASRLKEKVAAALDKTENVTLQLRLRVMLAEMAGTTIELGETLIAELDDLSAATPPVLAVLCDASFDKGNYSRGEEILNVFRKYFQDSEFMNSAYKLRVYDLFEKNRLEEAMKIVMEAEARYGSEGDTAWIQIIKGRIQMERGNLNTARETFELVLSARTWRGEPHAETTYRLGELEEKAGNLKKAFAWYQRTYFQYKGHANGYWAAEGYLASAHCLKKLNLLNEMRNTYRAMLYDKYVNTLPQAQVAREALGAAEALEIKQKIAYGHPTNLVVRLESKVPAESNEPVEPERSK